MIERVAQCAVQFKRRARDLRVRDIEGWRLGSGHDKRSSRE